MHNLSDFLKELKQSKKRFCVLGDLILDEYLVGEVNRISPEAPVPVHHVTRQEARAGGAANAALNIHGLAQDVRLVGIIGKDLWGEELLACLIQEGLSTASILRDPAVRTIKKTRVTAQRQQLVRLDWESSPETTSQHDDFLLAQIAAVNPQALLISDYGKGYLPRSLLAQVLTDKLTIVDPKGTDYSKYRGASFLTPNRSELQKALGVSQRIPTQELKEACEALHKKFGLQETGLVITLSEDGVFYFPAKSSQDKVALMPAKARQVFDVSGAGDTMAAVLTVGLAMGKPVAETLQMANIAAGIVVGRSGTYAIKTKDIEDEILEPKGLKFSQQNKIFADAAHFKKFLDQNVDPLKEVGFTNGCFDILHAGHAHYLQEARKLCDYLVVAVNSDSSVRGLNKGGDRPIIPLKFRMELLAALACVDAVFAFDEPTPLEAIQKVQPHFLFKGSDWKVDEVVGRDIVEQRGGRVKLIDHYEGLSTTQTIQKIIKSNES